MYDQLLRQKMTSQKGFCVRRPTCQLCRQHLATQIDAIVFQCGHSFHVSCLERAGCLFFVNAGNGDRDGADSKPVDEHWQCYSCVTKNLVRALTKTNESDANQASLTTERSTKTSQDIVTKSDVVEEITNRHVRRALEFLSRYKSPASYLAVVDSMGQPVVSLSTKVSDVEVPRHTSVFDLPTFNLKLSPDPPESHS